MLCTKSFWLRLCGLLTAALLVAQLAGLPALCFPTTVGGPAWDPRGLPPTAGTAEWEEFQRRTQKDAQNAAAYRAEQWKQYENDQRANARNQALLKMALYILLLVFLGFAASEVVNRAKDRIGSMLRSFSELRTQLVGNDRRPSSLLEAADRTLSELKQLESGINETIEAAKGLSALNREVDAATKKTSVLAGLLNGQFEAAQRAANEVNRLHDQIEVTANLGRELSGIDEKTNAILALVPPERSRSDAFVKALGELTAQLGQLVALMSTLRDSNHAASAGEQE